MNGHKLNKLLGFGNKHFKRRKVSKSSLNDYGDNINSSP